MSKVAVIGAGAAGMMAAYSASMCGHSVDLYEKNEKTGKKIYITGKGRCNLTNKSDMEVILKNIVSNSKFMYSALYALSNDALADLFETQFGVPLKVERGNRVFPKSDKSSDIINGLTRSLKSMGVNILLNEKVKDIIVENTQNQNNVKGIVLGNGENVFYDSVIVATGGFSYQSTGSDGDGYKFARKNGINVTDICPALVPLNVKEEYVKKLQGLSLKNVCVSFLCENRIIYKDFGEMMFTHFGITGPVILSASSFLSKKLKDNKEVRCYIDLKPALTERELDDRILRDFKGMINKDFLNSLNGLLPAKIIPVVIELSGILPHKKVNEITREERKMLVKILKAFPLTVTSTRGFNEAIITQGGVDTKDINPGTMESKNIKNLYFAGEVLDVDALTGGYNLQVAFSTGYLAGISVK